METNKSKKITLVFDSLNECRLDKFLGNLPEVGSRSRAAQLIENNLVQVNSKKTKASLLLKNNDVITVEIPTEPVASDLTPYKLSLDIIFEDESLIVLNKPAGLVVHPAAGHASMTLVNALINHTSELSMGFNETRPGIVHRIDKDTSGLLVVAKTDQAHKHLALQFKQKTTHRVYWALCYGIFKETFGTFKSHLARHSTNRKKFASTKDASKGKLAITHYKQSAVYQKEFSLLKLKLETGRTHQIRVHLSESGHPIVGDSLYGADSRTRNIKNTATRKAIESLPRFVLHAAELGFLHPVTNQDLSFSIDWPADLLPIVKLFGFEKGAK